MLTNIGLACAFLMRTKCSPSRFVGSDQFLAGCHRGPHMGRRPGRVAHMAGRPRSPKNEHNATRLIFRILPRVPFRLRRSACDSPTLQPPPQESALVGARPPTPKTGDVAHSPGSGAEGMESPPPSTYGQLLRNDLRGLHAMDSPPASARVLVPRDSAEGPLGSWMGKLGGRRRSTARLFGDPERDGPGTS